LGSGLGLSAAAIPHLYNWSSILCTGALVSVFCLKRFRVVLRSDLLRLLVCQAILIVSDFETRTFISFSYFSGFFILVIVALASVERANQPPWYAWIIPVFCCSKPAVLSLIPAMVFVSFFTSSRFRKITLLSLGFGILQSVQLIVSRTTGKVPSIEAAASLAPQLQLLASVKYFLGFIAGYVCKRTFMNDPSLYMGGGVVILSLAMLLVRQKNKRTILLISLSVVFFSLLINCFALSREWSSDLKQLGGLPVNRQNQIAFSSIVFFVSILSSVCDEEKFFKNRRLMGLLSALIFFLWFAGVGWLRVGIEMNGESSSPWIFNSQWQNNARAIDKASDPLCVPLDPLNWIYGKNCKFLNGAIWGNGASISLSRKENILLDPKEFSVRGDLVSLALMVINRDLNFSNAPLKLIAFVELTGGREIVFYGYSRVRGGKGLVQLVANEIVKIEQIKSIRLTSSEPCLLELYTSGNKQLPLVLWMGNEATL